MTITKLPYQQSPCDVQVELTVYPMFDGERGALKIPFALSRGEVVLDALNLFMGQHQVHATLTASLLSLVNEAIRKTLSEQVNVGFLRRILSKTEDEIKVDAIAFNKKVYENKDPSIDEKDIFSFAIRCLCKTPQDTGFLLHLVRLENAYNQTYFSRMANWDSQTELITQQQHDEIQDGRLNLSERALNAKRLQFSQDFDMLKQTRDAELFELRENQKAEYRQWVGLLHLAYQAWQNRETTEEKRLEFDSQFGISALEELLPATYKYYFSENESASKELCSALGLDKRLIRGHGDPVSSEEAASHNLDNEESMEINSAILELQSMGFEETSARCALRLSKGSMEEAIALLLDVPDRLMAEIQKETSQTLRPKTPTAESKIGSNILDKTRSWFEKTTLFLNREDSRNEVSTPKELKVRFIAVLGSHLRTPYNIGLTTVEPLNDHTEETRITTLSELYRPELTCRLVFFHPTYAPKYHLGRLANSWLFEACDRTNELHFPSLRDQLATGLDKLLSSKAGLQEGDFFITRHSNLPNTHVVVHMVLDASNSSFPEDLSHRPLLIGGIRSLFVTAQRYGVSRLIFPLPEPNTPTVPTSLSQKLTASANSKLDPSSAAKIKLFESFFRCIKGLLLETNRSGSVPYPVLPGKLMLPALGISFLMHSSTTALFFKKARACIRVAFNQ